MLSDSAIVFNLLKHNTRVFCIDGLSMCTIIWFVIPLTSSANDGIVVNLLFTRKKKHCKKSCLWVLFLCNFVYTW